MPAISFSCITHKGPCWYLILIGEKRQTVRKPRVRPISPGHILKLYWKQRIPANKKPIHLIGQAQCRNVERIYYKDFAFNDDFARADGFRNAEEMQEWFGDPLEYAMDEYDVISWASLFSKSDILKCPHCGETTKNLLYAVHLFRCKWRHSLLSRQFATRANQLHKATSRQNLSYSE